MTKHASGKYGRTIGQKERKAGWPSPAMAWCYQCNGTHRWEDGCVSRNDHPTFIGQRTEASTRRHAA